MAKYTVQLRSIVESGVTLFDFDYPIFNEAYRTTLEQKIIDTYYFREIGFETVAQFKHFLKMKMNNIMPFYNKLYDSEGLVTKDNYNINLNTTESVNRTVEAENNETSKGKSIFSDTPQAKLQGLDYATNMSESDGEGGGTANSSETAESKVTGSGGLRYNADILMEWRKSFLNIDLQIIEELNDLFMNIY